jgi:Rod binding domain-containing protein
MDIKGIKGRPQAAPPPSLDDQLKSAAKMYERQFLEEMMKSMKKTVSHSEITKPSMAENIYTDEMYSQYADKWTESGGNGLADVIYKELKEKILPSQHSRYLPNTEPPPKSTIKIVK